MIDVEKITRAFDDFDKAVQPTGASGVGALPGDFDACGTWHNVEDTVSDFISGLNDSGALFPVAKRAGDVLQTLKDRLDVLCPQ